MPVRNKFLKKKEKKKEARFTHTLENQQHPHCERKKTITRKKSTMNNSTNSRFG